MSTTVTPQHPTVRRNEAIVAAFIEAWHQKDLEAAMALLAPEIEYINQPLAPIVGKPGVRTLIKALMDQSHSIEFKLIRLFGAGDHVCTERLDCWDFDGKGVALRLPCVGMFDVNAAGKICGWRDYFDLNYWHSNGGPSLEL